LIIPSNSQFLRDELNGEKLKDDDEVRDVINTKTLEELRFWGLATEKYHREVNNMQAFGGLHDYVNRLEKPQLIDYIMNEVNEHEELVTAKDLDKLVEKYKFKPSYLKPPTELPLNKGGLHDYIFKKDRQTLLKWSLASEAYFRKKEKSIMVGGLHDYIHFMDNKSLIGYILNMAREYPELDDGSKLDELVKEYQIDDLDKSGLQLKFGGLHDLLHQKSRCTLIKWAIAVEYYHRKVKGIEVEVGGIHDYIHSLDKKLIIKYILQEAQEHPEIDNEEAIEKIKGEMDSDLNKP